MTIQMGHTLQEERAAKRVLLYSLNFHPELTGIGKFNAELVKWLASRGWCVQVVCSPPYYPEWKVHQGYRGFAFATETYFGAKVYRAPVWVPKRPNGLKRIVHLLSFAISSAPVLFRIAWRSRPAAVIVTQPPLMCAPNCLLASLIAGATSWMHVQDLEVDAALGLGMVRGKWIGKLVSAVESRLLSAFDIVSSISEAMCKRIANKGLAESDVFLWPNWVDSTQIFPLGYESAYRKELGVERDDIVALYSGNLGKKQGIELIVSLAKALEHVALPAKIIFVICGHGVEYHALRAATKDVSNVRWLPLQPYERLNELLGMADVHLLPQLSGAADLVMPSKLASILASGVPVLACAEPGTEVHKFASKGGICVPPGDLDALHCQLLRLACSPALRLELGAAGRAVAEEELSMQKILESFEAKLKHATKTSRLGNVAKLT